jgi:uncharacterized protein
MPSNRGSSGFLGLARETNVSQSFLAACALVLVLEGLLPLLAPRAWRDAFRRLTELSDGQLRFVGLLSVAIGAILLALVYA